MNIAYKTEMIRDGNIDRMIPRTRKEANPLYPVPVVWSRGDVRRLIERVRR